MSTAYNHFNDAFKAKQADRTVLLDPGVTGGVVTVSPTDSGVVTLATAGTYTLQPATELPVDVSVLVLAQAAVTAESVVLADGDWAEFVVVVNAAGANVWAQRAGTSITEAGAAFAVAPVDLGTVTVTITDAPTAALVVEIANLLIDRGLATGTIT